MLQQEVTQNGLGRITEKYLMAYWRWVIVRALLLPKGGNNDLSCKSTLLLHEVLSGIACCSAY